MDADNPFGPEVVEAVAQHMNDDHAGDSLLIVRALGGRPDATTAETTGLDGRAIEFRASVPDGEPVTVRVPWSAPLTERAQIRAEVTRMYHEACAALGETPRGGDEEH
ncbi:DUF2470 domain-containing protein [Saccharopolyspora montiporae]|uniref:DUF2470 domain-containing protein n=1 Tax=Saccharopolyspora montiporae TaxID=2781240 RepID=UPI00351C3800